MENTNIILIEEQEKEDARALTQSFARSDVKARAYINALGAEVCKKYFEKENITSERTFNLHNIRKILEEFDISDIMLSNIHIDVRVIFDENQIFIPKTHFEYNLLPDIYIVLKLEKEHKNIECLGFFEPKLINKNNANSDYYFIEKEKLSSPIDLKNFIENFQGSTSKEYSEEDISNAELLMVSMADNNVTEDEKRTLIDYLINSAELRDEFIEFENFEMLSYQAISTVGVEIPIKTEEMDVAEIPSEELSEDIAEEMLAEQANSIEDNLNPETTNDVDENLIKGAAVLGAEIAGTAMVSAALAGTEEVAESAVINAAANVANITSDAIDMASSIQNMAEQVFSDDNIEGDSLGESVISDIANTENLETQAFDGLSISEENLTLDENIETVDFQENIAMEDIVPPIEDAVMEEENVELPAEQELNDSTDVNNFSEEQELPQIEDTILTEATEAQDIQEASLETSAVDESENLTGSLDDLFGDFSESENDDIFGGNSDGFDFQDSSSSDELVFGSSSSDSDDLVFENYAGDDEITFSNNDDYGDFEYNESYGATSSSEARNQSLPQAHGVHTPISEATELMSLEDIKNGNIPPQNSAPADTSSSQMETMEMDEFHSLVDSYVPTEIKNESVTVGFESIGQEQAQSPQNSEINNTDSQSTTEKNMTHDSDAFVEDMPEINEESSNWDAGAEPTSDDFVEDMPDEIENIASNLQLDNLTSDDFIEEMPQENELASNWDIGSELTSDDFVEDMPDVESAQEATSAQGDVKEELTSDDFVEDIEKLETNEETEESQTTQMSEITEENTEAQDDMSILDELDKLDSLGLGELESTTEQEEPTQIQDEEFSIEESDVEINENEELNTGMAPEMEEDNSLGLLYNENNSPELNDIELEQPAATDYDFKPAKKSNRLMPLFAIVAAVVIVGAIVGFLMKSKNSIDAETLIQAAPENEILATPEGDNSDILANTGEAIPDIPQDATVPAPAQTPAPAESVNTPEQETKAPAAVKQAEKNSVAAEQAPKPLNGSKTVSVKKVSWEVPDYLSYSENIKKYLQTAGKSIKLTLSSDLLLTSEYIYSNQVKVDLKLSKDGNIQSSKIIKSSGSEEVDKIVLRTVNETLNVVKPAQGEVPTPNYNLAIIIYL